MAAHAVLFGFAKEYYLPLRALLDVFGMGGKTTGVCKVSNITNQKIRRIIDEA